MEDYIVVDDTIHIDVGFAEKIQEKQIVEIFRKLQKINSYGISKSYGIYGMNLNSSLSHYERAMSEFSKLFKFKYLFNALEIATDIDGNDIKRDDLDKEAKRIDPMNCTDVEKWRKFYNRIRHVQRNPRDIKIYEEGEKDLSQKLLTSRRCTQEVLLSRLY